VPTATNGWSAPMPIRAELLRRSVAAPFRKTARAHGQAPGIPARTLPRRFG